jgi:hypothetical protein
VKAALLAKKKKTLGRNDHLWHPGCVFALARHLNGCISLDKKTGIFMNEFLLLTLVIVYVVISYVPISDDHNSNWQKHRNQQSSPGNTENDPGTRF